MRKCDCWRCRNVKEVQSIEDVFLLDPLFHQNDIIYCKSDYHYYHVIQRYFRKPRWESLGWNCPFIGKK